MVCTVCKMNFYVKLNILIMKKKNWKELKEKVVDFFTPKKKKLEKRKKEREERIKSQVLKELNNHRDCFAFYKYYYENYPETREIFASYGKSVGKSAVVKHKNYTENRPLCNDFVADFISDLFAGKNPSVEEYENKIYLQRCLVHDILKKDRKAIKKDIARGADLFKRWTVDYGYSVGDEWYEELAVRDCKGHAAIRLQMNRI